MFLNALILLTISFFNQCLGSQYCLCENHYGPVCGVNNVTYINRCHAHCSGYEVLYDNICVNFRCPCPDYHLKEFCGNDGVLYSKCEYECWRKHFPKLAISEKQVCRDTCRCSGGYKICGTNGFTYSDICAFNCAAVKQEVSVKYLGSCRDAFRRGACTCTRDLSPVCGDDGETYPNKCLLLCNKRIKVSDGPCEGDAV